ncbi:hypothetical protein TWF225_012010 [Orbilia oligospora]|uniref:Uncharacterized protein n=1 Tax=Orbilia oligospora TaxID=2813651 RepID=A0A7C8KG68_ORBOL|nr:hypothetical protein TWF225_012010 [Orbilia oligospora]KAF3175295.1 hypothetical protein TWF751_004494 [Orbilia oligospora]KAF3239020.1 hypothetical protein TWF128_011892 [Orbilia oligospora]KAF3244290.1 hypothetical protein TWF217_010791 [Orbilia oligospora]KAF3283502.1 hypothetical protein TWF132_010308 [Orbilia oligospora]
MVAAWPFLYDNDGGFAYAPLDRQLSPWLHLADKMFRIDRSMYPVTPIEPALCMPDGKERGKKRTSAFSQTTVASSMAVQFNRANSPPEDSRKKHTAEIPPLSSSLQSISALPALRKESLEGKNNQ